MRVLIVEDERLLAESLKTLLERKGFTVETAYDGISGAEYAETGIYDLLILDVMRHIALNPIQVPAPGEEFDGVRLPYFVLSVGEDGTIEPAGGGYYDLSDTEFLQQAAEEAVDSGRQNGVLTDSHLRFLRLDTDSGSTIVFADTSNETQTLTGLFRTCLLLCSAAFIAF